MGAKKLSRSVDIHSLLMVANRGRSVSRCADMRPFGQGRKFFRTKAEAETARLRQITSLARHGREAVGLPQRELSDFITASKSWPITARRSTMLHFYIDHLERERRCKTTVSELVAKYWKRSATMAALPFI